MRAFAQCKRLNIPPPAYAGPPPWLLRRAALRSNATSPLGKGGLGSGALNWNLTAGNKTLSQALRA